MTPTKQFYLHAVIACGYMGIVSIATGQTQVAPADAAPSAVTRAAKPTPSFNPATDLMTLSGKVYRNCTVERAEPDGVKIMHSEGVCKVLYREMLEADRKKFGYDPVKAQAFAQQQEERVEAARTQAVADSQRTAAYRRGNLQMRQATWFVTGKVLQAIEAGVLINDGEYGLMEIDATGDIAIKVPALVPLKQVVYVETSPDKYVDGDDFAEIVYLYGKYKYTAALGGERTVQAYTSDRKKGIAYLYGEQAKP